jgi:tRNA nucleotidyltransferase/poly(A) polymerase
MNGAISKYNMKFKTFLKEQESAKQGKEFLDYALPMNIRTAIKRKGGKVYQIGGAVRDSFVNKVSKDLDIIVTGLDLKELEGLLRPFGRVDMVGKSFGIIKFTPRHFKKGDEPIDVSVPRVEKNAKGGHKDVEIELGKHITLQQDQLRRDFWMNAIAQDIETGELIDVDGKGQLDIKNKQVRMISPEAFAEDGLRMLRAVQFASRFDFEIEPDTLKEIQRVAHTITKTVVPDRFVEEFKKLFHKSKKPSIGIEWFIKTGLYKEMFGPVKFSGKLFGGVDRLQKDDFVGFMTILLMPVGTPSEVLDAVNKIDPPTELGTAVSGSADFLQNKSKNMSAVDLVLTIARMSTKNNAREIVIKNVDNVTKAEGNGWNLQGRLDDLKKQGIPTSLKELSVKGNEVDVPKHEIQKKLLEILKYAVENKTNDKEALLKL